MDIKEIKKDINKLEEINTKTDTMPKVKNLIKKCCKSLLNSPETVSDAIAGINNLGSNKMIYEDSISDILTDMNDYHNVQSLIKATLHTWRFIYFDSLGETTEIPFKYHVAPYKEIHNKVNNILLKIYGIGNLPKVLSLRSEGMPDKNNNLMFYFVVLNKN